MATPFVGRTNELADLVALAPRAVGEHRPLATLIVAPAGHGKSRLLAEVRDRIAPAGRFEMTGFETERAVPLAAASELLRDLARNLAAGLIVHPRLPRGATRLKCRSGFGDSRTLPATLPPAAR